MFVIGQVVALISARTNQNKLKNILYKKCIGSDERIQIHALNDGFSGSIFRYILREKLAIPRTILGMATYCANR